MNDLRNFLQNFLISIEYPDDKEDFINKMVSTMYLKTLEELLNTLPQDKQEIIKQQLSLATTPESLQEIVNNNFQQNNFEEALKRNSQTIFTDYLHTIDSALTEEQKTKLQQYFASVTPQATAR